MNPAALQQAIYTKLAGDATLVSALSSAWTDGDGVIPAIFSDTPQENADDPAFYPFISFGEGAHTPWDDKDTAGDNAVEVINVWSRASDPMSVKQIANRIHALLHRTPLTISGADHLISHVESVTVSKDPDGHTRRALMLVRVIYQNQ
jgi:hypothetical protein